MQSSQEEAKKQSEVMTDEQIDNALRGQHHAIHVWKRVLVIGIFLILLAAGIFFASMFHLIPWSLAGQSHGATPAESQETAQVMSAATSTTQGESEDDDGTMLTEEDEIDPPEYTLNDARNVAIAQLTDVDGDAELYTATLALTTQQRDQILTALHAITDQGYTVSFAAVDLGTGAIITSTAGHEYYSASSIKAPYITALAQTNTINLDAVSTGANPQVEYLITQTLSVSNNETYDQLVSTYGLNPSREWLTQIDVPNSVNGYYGYMQPVDLARMWVQMVDYEFSTEPEGEFSGVLATPEARQWLASQMIGSLNSSIYEAYGDEYTVYSKAGWINGEGNFYALNDAGYVAVADADSLSDEPSGMVIAVMSTACGRNDLLVPLVQAVGNAFDL